MDRGATTPVFYTRLNKDQSNVANSARSGSNYVGGNIVIDYQTAPDQDSTAAIASSVFQNPRARALTKVKSPSSAPIHIAVFATNLRTLAAIQVTPTVTFTSTDWTIVDLGEFFLLEGYQAAIRMWSGSVVMAATTARIGSLRTRSRSSKLVPSLNRAPSSKLSAPTEISGGGYCQGVLTYFRSHVYQAVDYIDPACTNESVVAVTYAGPPQNVTQELKLTHSLLGSYQPFVSAVPGPSHPEFIQIGLVSGEEPKSVGNDQFSWGVKLRLNSGPLSDFTLAIANIDGGLHGRGLSADFGNAIPFDPVSNALPYNQNTATVTVPGDSYGVQAEFVTNVYGNNDYFLSDVVVCNGIQAMQAICSDNGRTIAYAGPLPAAVERYEARVYYINGSQPFMQLVESLGTITANPYTFPIYPPFDPAFHSGDNRYFFVVRAYYYDGSWTQNGCVYEPRGGFVFRHRHKAAR